MRHCSRTREEAQYVLPKASSLWASSCTVSQHFPSISITAWLAGLMEGAMRVIAPPPSQPLPPFFPDLAERQAVMEGLS
eukprot:scaffold291128_cov27-Tisochrysis_lutea.AAC.2